MVVFMIVGKNEPIYEIELSKSTVSDVTDELAYLHQFILFSSLDVINSAMWTNNATFVYYHSVILTILCIFHTFSFSFFYSTPDFSEWLINLTSWSSLHT